MKSILLFGALAVAVAFARADRPEWMRPVAPDPAPDYEVFVNGGKVDLLAVETATENVPKGRDFSGWY